MSLLSNGYIWVWRDAFPGGQVDPEVGPDISCPLEMEAWNVGHKNRKSGLPRPPLQYA